MADRPEEGWTLRASARDSVDVGHALTLTDCSGWPAPSFLTGASGVLFCELRIRSGSLLAPMVARWAGNGMGVIFVRTA